jgi:glycosyltransferase involved in cell wall biosynthesis
MLSHYFAQHQGGIEAVAAALARELSARGFEVVWLASGDPGSNGGQPAYRCVSLTAASLIERRFGIPYPLLRASAWRTIYRESAYQDVIVVHDALYMSSILGYLAARLRRKALVVVQHVGFVPYQSAALRTAMRLANRLIAMPLLRGADQVIFISELTLRHFSNVRWRRPPALVFNGVDTDIFWPAADAAQVESERRALGLPGQAAVALFVGRFVEKKGLHCLEHLARRCAEVLFVFAGHGPLDPRGWRLPNVRVYAGLGGAQLAALYRASDVLLLPSTGEGFPLVLQEALACGLAIICGSDTASADERAASLLTGVPVDQRDPAGTARRFREELTRVLGRARPQAERSFRSAFARASYSWSASGTRYAEILRELCAPPAAPQAPLTRLDGNPSGVVDATQEE